MPKPIRQSNTGADGRNIFDPRWPHRVEKLRVLMENLEREFFDMYELDGEAKDVIWQSYVRDCQGSLNGMQMLMREADEQREDALEMVHKKEAKEK